MTSTEGISYELASKLKKHGFPQGEPNGFVGLYNLDEGDENGQAYFPSLSQLVAACGEKFHYLSDSSRFKDLDGETKKWVAYSKNHCHLGIGTIPEEAVANLYLALHPLSGGGNNK